MKFYPSWWRKNFLAIELFIAVLATAILMFWWKFGLGVDVLPALIKGNRSQIYGTLASIAGSLLGFVITALSVILGFSSAERLKILRKSPYYKQLWNVFKSSIRVLALTTIIWLTALLFDREVAQKPVLLILGLGLSLLAIFRLARSVWVLSKIVDILTAIPERDGD